MRGQFRAACLFGLALAGCSTSFHAKRCSADEDCANGLVCELRDRQPVCVDAKDAPITIGQSAPITGTNQELGTQMKLGIELALQEQNAAGGIRGRKLKLEFRDDAYQPELAEQAARTLVDVQVEKAAPRCPTTAVPVVAGESPVSKTALQRGPKAVIAFLGNVGTPTMVRSAPVAIETGTLFFGAFTGATTLLRDDLAATCERFIFNVRASYKEEARATLEYFKNRGVKDHRHLLSFDQNDSFGQAGYDGLVAAYSKVIGRFPSDVDESEPIARFRYARNDDSSVPDQAALAAAYIASLLAADSEVHAVGIMMTDTYGAAATFIEGVRRWQYADGDQQQKLQMARRLRLQFSNVSFVGPNALAKRLVSVGSLPVPSGEVHLTQDVMVSQVVPNYASDASESVISYNRLLKKAGHEPSFTSLEGYISARVFIAGLEAHVGPFEPEGLVETFERLPVLNLGFGSSSGFSAKHHQYSSSVWGTSIEPDGSFKNVYFWSAEAPIELFE